MTRRSSLFLWTLRLCRVGSIRTLQVLPSNPSLSLRTRVRDRAFSAGLCMGYTPTVLLYTRNLTIIGYRAQISFWRYEGKTTSTIGVGKPRYHRSAAPLWFFLRPLRNMSRYLNGICPRMVRTRPCPRLSPPQSQSHRRARPWPGFLGRAPRIRPGQYLAARILAQLF